MNKPILFLTILIFLSGTSAATECKPVRLETSVLLSDLPITDSIGAFISKDEPSQRKNNSRLLVGASNRLFVFDGEGVASFGPSVKFQFSNRFEVGTQFYRFKTHSVSGAIVVRDVSPYLIYSIDKYFHLPFSLKYNWLKKGLKNYFIQFALVNQFKKYERTRYTFQKGTTTGNEDYFNILLSAGAGIDFRLCDKIQSGLEIYFQTDKRLANPIYGLNISFDYSIRL